METKTVNTIPEGMSAMFHASQGDNGDTKTVRLTEELPASLDYIGMIPYLQAVIKEQEKRIEALEKKIGGLK